MSMSEPDGGTTTSGGGGHWYQGRQLVYQVGAYVIVNALFVAIWATSGTKGRHGSFWPIWPIIFWGVAVAFFALRSLTARPGGKP